MSRWKIDPAHTDVAFSTKHLMVIRLDIDVAADEVLPEAT